MSMVTDPTGVKLGSFPCHLSLTSYYKRKFKKEKLVMQPSPRAVFYIRTCEMKKIRYISTSSSKKS